MQRIHVALLAAITALAISGCASARPTGGASAGASGQDGNPNSVVGIGYKHDGQFEAFRQGLHAPGDPATIAGISSTTAGEFSIRGRPNIPVGARFTDASQTCKVRLWLYNKNTSGAIKTVDLSDEVTLTGSAIPDEDGNYIAPRRIFDSGGASFAKVMLTDAPSSGDVDLWVGSF